MAGDVRLEILEEREIVGADDVEEMLCGVRRIHHRDVRIAVLDRRTCEVLQDGVIVGEIRDGGDGLGRGERHDGGDGLEAARLKLVG